MPDLSSVTSNYLTESEETFSDNLASTIVALAATVPVNSTAPYSDGDQCVITVEPGTANQATFTGTVSGNSFINCVWTEGNLAVGHNSGKTVVDYDSATHHGMLVKHLQQQHNADGTHSAVTATSLSVGSQSWATMATGWMDAAETWTYTGSTTFTISGDKTSKYTFGTRISLVQSATTKYFFVVSSALGGGNTTVTLNTTTDYSLANAAISSPRYSYDAQPAGYPHYFAWTPTFTNLSGGTLNYARYSQVGKTIFFKLKYTLAGAGVAGGVTFTTPTAMVSSMTANTEVIPGRVYYTDTGTANFYGTMTWATASTIAMLAEGVGGTWANASALSATVPYTWASTDVISAAGSYESA